MSLDVTLTAIRPTAVFEHNITHNLAKMAEAVDLYQPLWRPEEVGITHANQLIEPLRIGLARLITEKEKLLPLNPPNGWGNYDGLVKFVTKYLAACEENPDATVSIDR